MAVIDFRKNADKLFTDVFYWLQKAITRYIVLKGGAGSSKSYSSAQHELILLMKRKDSDTLVLRKYGADLRESVYKLYCDLIDKYGLSHLFKCNFSNDNRRITYLPTGRSIIFKGVDDSEKLKSIVGIKRIVMEEASQFDLKDFMEIVRRARGIEGIQITLILNPISENHWIKKNLCDVGGGYHDRCTELTATYHNNPFLTEEDILELEAIRSVSENQYRIYVLAEWGIEDRSKKFAHAFRSLDTVLESGTVFHGHVKKTVYDPNHILWLSFDFNVNPISCTAFQHYYVEEYDAEALRGIHSFKLDNSSIYSLCAAIIAKFPDAQVMVTGDATGKNRSAMTQENTTYYTIIKDEMGLSWSQFKVPTVNPPIEENQLVVNAVLHNVIVELDPDNCAPLIYDLTFVEVGDDKKIIKDRQNNKRKADFLDHFRYICNILFPNIARLRKKAA